MKKLIAILLSVVMTVALVACGNSGVPSKPDDTKPSVTEPAATDPMTVDPAEPTEPAESLDDGEIVPSDTENILYALAEKVPMEFPVTTWAVDLTDADAVKFCAGLDSVDKVEEISITEPAMSSQAYSIVLVKVKDVADAEAVAEEMKNGVDPRKWICVEADDLDVAICDNYILLAMLSSDFAETVTASGVTDAFKTIIDDYSKIKIESSALPLDN